MGLVLGLTLGIIGFFRGGLTPAEVRGGSKEFKNGVTLQVPKDTPIDLTKDPVVLPPTAVELSHASKPRFAHVPAGTKVEVDETQPGFKEYRFPANTEVRKAPVDRWRLGLVIGLAVMGICIWGTLIGSMLPLVFRRLGADPGVASSPFVATFVDVTGIVIFFTIAKVFLLN